MTPAALNSSAPEADWSCSTTACETTASGGWRFANWFGWLPVTGGFSTTTAELRYTSGGFSS